jgi:hypothetical protein
VRGGASSESGDDFDEDKGEGAAEGTWEDVGGVLREEVGGEDGIEGVEGFGGSLWGEDELELSKNRAEGRAPEAVVPDFVEAFGRHMVKESTDELLCEQGHDAPLRSGRVLISEDDLAVVDGDEPAVADGNAMDVSG